MRAATKETTDGVVEHLPSCGARCVAGCEASPRRAWRDLDTPPPPRTRRLHTGPIPEEKLYPRPLWENLDDPGAVDWHRQHGCEVRRRSGSEESRTLLGLPLPPLDGPERAGVYNLDRWRAGGAEDERLDELHRTLAAERKSRAKETPDIATIAGIVRNAFAGVIDGSPRPAVAVKKRPASGRARELLELVIGEAPAGPASTHAPMFEATEHVRQVFKAFAWALALVLFRREKDPLSDYAFGRLFKGEPIRETRAPFASPAHVLAVAGAPLPGLGGGSCPWPTDDPRMRQRTWAKSGEMRVSSVFHGTDHVRGERAVHRVLDARAATRRAGLTSHELAAVEVLADQELTRDEKVRRLRETEACRRGFAVPTLDGVVPTPEARADLMRVTADVSDGELVQQARAAARRLGAAVDRVSRTGDRLAPPRPPERQRRGTVQTTRIVEVADAG